MDCLESNHGLRVGSYSTERFDKLMGKDHAISDTRLISPVNLPHQPSS